MNHNKVGYLDTISNRYSPKEGGRSDAARPKTNIQVVLSLSFCKTKDNPPQTLDGKFAGKTENQGEYSAKDGAGRVNQARPGTNIKVQSL